MKNIESLLIPVTASLRDVRLCLESSAMGVALLIDADRRLLRTITDGDLRRATLDEMGNDTLVAKLPKVNVPVSLGLSATMAQVLSLMDEKSIDHVPIVNEFGRVVDLIHRRELSSRVWLSSPHIGLEESAFVTDAFASNWIAPLGPHVDAFERELAEYVGLSGAAAMSSGTAAIHIGLLLLGVVQGDSVFCSSLTFVGSCNPILQCGAQPVFIDSEPQTWNMSPAALERAMISAQKANRLPRCVVIVNLYGQSADMDVLLPICERFGVPVLEDAAESLGASYKGRASGTFGTLSVFSFNGNKIITTSGGGMLLGNSAELIARARKLSTQAREPERHFEHKEQGFNYRLSNVLAGIGRGQMRVLEQRVVQRRAVFQRYVQELADFEFIHWMPEPAGYRSTRWLTCATLLLPDADEVVLDVMRSLERHSIEARPVWKPMHMQPLYRDAEYVRHGDTGTIDDDVSGGLYRAGICLPSGSNTTAEQQTRVIRALRDALAKHSAAGGEQYAV